MHLGALNGSLPILYFSNVVLSPFTKYVHVS